MNPMLHLLSTICTYACLQMVQIVTTTPTSLKITRLAVNQSMCL
jgi:hypothetical protein